MKNKMTTVPSIRNICLLYIHPPNIILDLFRLLAIPFSWEKQIRKELFSCHKQNYIYTCMFVRYPCGRQVSGNAGVQQDQHQQWDPEENTDYTNEIGLKF